MISPRYPDRFPRAKFAEKCQGRSPNEIAAVLKQNNHLKIVETLLAGVTNVKDIQRKTGLPMGVLREQLRMLKTEGILVSEYSGVGAHWLPEPERMRSLVQYARTGVMPEQARLEDRQRYIKTLADEVCRAVAAGVSEGHREV